jgi:ubiquitin
VASLPDVTSSKEAAPTASSPSDAPAAFVADRHPRGGGNWGRAGRNDQRATGSFEGRGGRYGGNKKQRQHRDNVSGIPDWFTGDQRQWERWCENRRPGGKIDLRNKEKESKESQSRDKRKRNPDEEADLADAPPQAQKFCFNLEHQASGSDLLDALADVGQAAQHAEPLLEKAQSTGSSSSESESEQKSDSGCKKRVRGRRSQAEGPDPGSNTKEKSTVNSPKAPTSAAGFSYLRRVPLMFLALLVTCLTQLGTAAEVMFGSAMNNIIFDSLTFFLTKVLQCVTQNNNRRFLSGTVLLGIFVFLDMISSTFSERIGSPSVKISNSSFEALFANAADNHTAQTVGNQSPWILNWIVDNGASCHICNDSSCFVNPQPCNVKISTAKSGEFIVATGIGDIRLNTWNAQGHPVSLILQQGYLISEARRNLLSVSSLKKEFITVLGVDNPILAPGIYDSRKGELKRNEHNRIPIEKVSNLYFVKTASNGSSLSNENPWVVMQRRLGYMPLSAIRPLVSRSVGLEMLTDVPFPKDFIDENSMMGKAVNRDKPNSVQSRCSAPMEIVGWDIFGPCNSPSFGGHHYCAVFVDHFSRYCWVYMLKDKSEMPEILK